MQDVLRAADRERRDDHIALAAREGVIQGKRELVQRLRQVLVVAIAVGRFDQQHVGILDRGRVRHHGHSGLAQVAGKDDLPSPSEQLDDRRAEDVAGVAEAEAQRRMRPHLRIVVRRHQVLEARLRLLLRIERRFAAPFRLLLLQIAAVGEHHAEQVAGRLRGVDRAAETLRDQARDQAGMVDVRVREQDESDVVRLEREPPVLRVGSASALEHAAVHEEPDLAGIDLTSAAAPWNVSRIAVASR
jgi:hypothetical protein